MNDELTAYDTTASKRAERAAKWKKKFKFQEHRKRVSAAAKSAIQLDLIDDSNNNNSELLKREQRT